METIIETHTGQKSKTKWLLVPITKHNTSITSLHLVLRKRTMNSQQYGYFHIICKDPINLHTYKDGGKNPKPVLFFLFWGGEREVSK